MQVTVGCPDGLDVPRLIAAIQAAYVTKDGKKVRVSVGQGVAFDGLPPGYLLLEVA